MKRYGVIISCIVMLLAATCKKEKKDNSGTSKPKCAMCYNSVVGYERDSSGVYFFLPTAFTPNGDGKNDLLHLIYENMDTANSAISVWDSGGKLVFTGGIAQRWDGRNDAGVAYPAGKYPVELVIKTSTGKAYDICACVTILEYTGSCINTYGTDYFFEDQLNPDSAFVYTTGESICP